MHPLLDLDSHPVIGHRGASGLAPENTVAAFGLAVEQGADAIELDVRLSVDGVPVVFHDPVLERTTDGTGPLGERTAAELARLDAGYRFPPDGQSFPWRGRGEGVPRLSDVLDHFPTTPLLIELKVAEAAGPVKELLRHYAAESRVVIASFLEEALAPFRDGHFRTSAPRRGIIALALRSRLGFSAPRIPDQAYAVPMRYKNLIPVPTERFIRVARQAGCPVHVWTVNRPADAATLWLRGVSGVITNFPALMIAERKRVFPDSRVA